jgi:hypothetical protein
MIDDIFVIDGVAHGYDFSPSNRLKDCETDRYRKFGSLAYRLAHAQVESTEPGYLLSFKEFSSRWHAADLAHAFFAESDVDAIVYHAVEISSYCREGASRWDTGLEMKRAAPSRVLLYAAVDSFDPDRSRVFDGMERMAAEGAVGFKFYPSNGFFDRDANRLVKMFYDDPEKSYPYFEKARSLGIKHVAFHKTMPVGPGPTDAAHVEDVSTAAAMFPDMTFEIVHSGWAFLEECALQLKLHANVYANLECVANLVVRQPRRFAHIIGTMLLNAEPERILFATGCAINHPDPILRAFMDFEMPEDLRDGYGYGELTLDIKRKILGENMARLLNFDIAGAKRQWKNDDWSRMRARGKAAPWSAHRDRVLASAYPYPGFED